MNTTSASAPPVHLLGIRIRSLRKEKGKTLAIMAEETGLSRGFLSQVENGQTQLSLNALYRIASALGTAAPDLLAAGVQPPVSIVRATDGEWQPASEDNPDQLTRSLLSTPRKGIEAHECTIPPGFRSDPPWNHGGEEFLYVLEGQLTVEIDGLGTYDLGECDAITYSASNPHRWITHSTQARVINVISSCV